MVQAGSKRLKITHTCACAHTQTLTRGQHRVPEMKDAKTKCLNRNGQRVEIPRQKSTLACQNQLPPPILQCDSVNPQLANNKQRQMAFYVTNPARGRPREQGRASAFFKLKPAAVNITDCSGVPGSKNSESVPSLHSRMF